EVYAITGRPMSLWQKQREGLGPEYAVRMFGLRMEPDALYRRISTRVERMFDAGIVREVKGLLKKRLSRTACAAIGIAEIKGYLDGEYGEDEAKRLMERNTRQYARRQMTWFRKEKRIEWIEVAEEERPEETAGRIEKMLK
ncbi:MAG: tRNA (adenosine(37)-N6)-dimethylallyltransferase MiaA, partial [Candidatus Omnitrophica bacterium]|nr:tRNA (adenosine(37)-N6)-dimethylallyltransferase MiaA [Candidatus Omnitrophota bacterium]